MLAWRLKKLVQFVLVAAALLSVSACDLEQFAGLTPAQVEGLSNAVEKRLNALPDMNGTRVAIVARGGWATDSVAVLKYPASVGRQLIDNCANASQISVEGATASQRNAVATCIAHNYARVEPMIPYSHAAFAVETGEGWQVVHLLDDGQGPEVFRESLEEFFGIALVENTALVATLHNDQQARLHSYLLGQGPTDSLAGRGYNLVAQPGEQTELQSNLFIAESLAGSAQILAQQGFTGTHVVIPDIGGLRFLDGITQRVEMAVQPYSGFGLIEFASVEAVLDYAMARGMLTDMSFVAADE